MVELILIETAFQNVICAADNIQSGDVFSLRKCQSRNDGSLQNNFVFAIDVWAKVIWTMNVPIVDVVVLMVV